MKDLIGLTENLRERVLELHAKFYKPAVIQKIISDESKQKIPIETVRDLTNSPRHLSERRLAMERWNDELMEEPFASKRYRLKICNDIFENLTKDEFADPKDFYNIKLKIVDLARREMEGKLKENVDTPAELESMVNKLHPFYQQQYLEGKIDLKKIIELVKTGKAYAMPERS